MTTRKQLARQALVAALDLRRKCGLGLTEVADIFDFVTNLDIEIRFIDIPSLEAMYTKKDEQPLILISSHRPSGRQVFNCAHELGHHIFSHGMKVDEYLDDNKGRSQRQFEADEYLADRFASYFLMPKSLVANAFQRRGWSPAIGSALQYYLVAGWIGVGYSTLIHQMRSSLNLLSSRRAKELLRVAPKQIRAEILGREVATNLVLVDLEWSDRAIEVQAGDFVLLPSNVQFEGKCARMMEQVGDSLLCQAIAPGIGRFVHTPSGWASYIRVSRQGYIGRSIFRHLEDPDYEYPPAA